MHEMLPVIAAIIIVILAGVVVLGLPFILFGYTRHKKAETGKLKKREAHQEKRKNKNMITRKGFKKQMRNAWNSDNDISERLIVMEDTIEDILKVYER